MFEHLFYKVLEQHIGAYIQDLNRDQLKVGVLKGKIVLRNVKLKPGAFDYLELPISIQEGSVDELTIKVPWTKLGSESVSILANGVTALVVPLQEHKRDAVKDSEHWTWDDAAKKQRLRANELLNFVAEDAAEGDTPGATLSGDSGSEKLSRKERILARMTDNISVTISNVHIRYLDNTPSSRNASVGQKLQEPLVFGISVESASVHATDAAWRPAFVDRKKHSIHTLLRSMEIRGLSMYCLVQTKEQRDRPSSSSLAVVEAVYSAPPDAVVLEPVSARLRMMQSSASQGAPQGSPRFPQVFHGEVGNINSKFNPSQTRAIVLMIERMTAHRAFLAEVRCREHRPTCSVKSNPKAWWQYAASAVTILLDTRSSRKRRGKVGWLEVMDRIRDRALYIECYRQRLMLDQRAIAKSQDRLGTLMGSHSDRSITENPSSAAESSDSAAVQHTPSFVSQKLPEISGMLKLKERKKLDKQSQLTLDILEEKLPTNVVLLFRAFSQGVVLQQLATDPQSFKQPKRRLTLPVSMQPSASSSDMLGRKTATSKNPAKWLKAKASNVLKRRKQKKLAKLVVETDASVGSIPDEDTDAEAASSSSEVLDQRTLSPQSHVSDDTISISGHQLLYESIVDDIGDVFGIVRPGEGSKPQSLPTVAHLSVQSLTLELRFTQSNDGASQELHFSIDETAMETIWNSGNLQKLGCRVGNLLAFRNNKESGKVHLALKVDREQECKSPLSVNVSESQTVFEQAKASLNPAAFKLEKSSNAMHESLQKLHEDSGQLPFLTFSMRASQSSFRTETHSEIVVLPLSIVADSQLVGCVLDEYITPNLDASLAIMRMKMIRETAASQVHRLKEEQSLHVEYEFGGISFLAPVDSKAVEGTGVQMQLASLGGEIQSSTTESALKFRLNSELKAVNIVNTETKSALQCLTSAIPVKVFTLVDEAAYRDRIADTDTQCLTYEVLEQRVCVTLPQMIDFNLFPESIVPLKTFAVQLSSLAKLRKGGSLFASKDHMKHPASAVGKEFEFQGDPAKLLRWKNEVTHFQSRTKEPKQSPPSRSGKKTKQGLEAKLARVSLALHDHATSDDPPIVLCLSDCAITAGSICATKVDVSFSVNDQMQQLIATENMKIGMQWDDQDLRSLLHVDMDSLQISWFLDPDTATRLFSRFQPMLMTSQSAHTKKLNGTGLVLRMGKFTTEFCSPETLQPFGTLCASNVFWDQSDGGSISLKAVQPVLSIRDNQLGANVPVLQPRTTEDLSTVEVAVHRDGDQWVVDSKLQSVAYHHVHQTFKELVDFCDVCIRRPIATLLPSDSSRNAEARANQPVLRGVVSSSFVRFTPQRCHSASGAPWPSVSLSFDQLSVATTDRTFGYGHQAVTDGLSLEGKLLEAKVTSTFPEEASRTILEGWSPEFGFTLRSFTDPEALVLRRRIGSGAPYSYVSGIRQEAWYPASSGRGVSSTLHMKLPGKSRCKLRQEDFHLMLLIVGETLGDWRRRYTLPGPLPDWAVEVGSEIFAAAGESREQVPESMRLPPEFTFVLDTDDLQVALVPRPLEFLQRHGGAPGAGGAEGAVPTNSIVRIKNGSLRLEDSSQRGRELTILAQSTSLEVVEHGDTCYLIAEASGQPKRAFLETPSLNRAAEEPATWSLNGDRGVQLRFTRPPHGFCELRTVYVSNATVLLEPIALQQFASFFDGTGKLRARLGCPEAIGLDPTTERRPRTVRWEFVVDSVVGMLVDQLPVGRLCTPAPSRPHRHFAGAAVQVVGKVYGNLTRYPTTNQIATLSGLGSVALARRATDGPVSGLDSIEGVAQVVPSQEDSAFTRSWLVRETTSMRLDMAKVTPKEEESEGQSPVPVRNTSVIVAPISVSCTQNQLGSLELVGKHWSSRYQAAKATHAKFKQRKQTKSTNLYTLHGVTAILNNDCGDYMIPVMRVCWSKSLLHISSESVSAKGRRVHLYSGVFMDLDPASEDAIFTQHKQLLEGPDNPGKMTHSTRHHIRHKGVYISYYNINIVAWEPLLEPFVFEWRVQRQGSTTSLMVEATQILNLNCTYAGIDTLLWLQSARVSANKSATTSRKHFSHYVINTTGSAFGVVSAGRELSDQQATWVESNGKRVPMSLRRLWSSRRTSTSSLSSQSGSGHRSKKKKIAIVWKGESGRDWYPVENVDVDQVGTFMYPLYPRYRAAGGDRTLIAKLVVDITTVEGSVYIRVSSAVEVSNQTSRALEVLLMPVADSTQLQSGGGTMLLGPINPGGKLAIPVDALNGQISVRPEGGHDGGSMVNSSFEWWEGLPVSALSRYRDQFLWVTCAMEVQYTEPRYRALDSFVCGAVVRQLSATNDLQSTMKQHVIEFIPPICMENLLPVNMYFELFAAVPTPKARKALEALDAAQQAPGASAVAEAHAIARDESSWTSIDSVRSGTVKPGQESGVLFHAQSPDFRVLVSIRLEGSTWSSRWPLVGPHNFDVGPLRSTADVVDRARRHLRLMVDTTRSHGSAFRVSPFVSAWFINRTSLGLSYRAGKSRVLDDMNEIMRQSRKGQAKFQRGQPVQVRLGGKHKWMPAIVLQVNSDTSFDILYENDEVELNVDVSLVRALDGEAQDVLDGPEVDGAGPVEEFPDSITMFSDSSLLSVRVTDSWWSKPFSLDSVGTRGAISMLRRSEGTALNHQRYEIGAQVEVAPAPFRRTKVITFVPRFTFVNALREDTLTLVQSSKLEKHKAKDGESAVHPLLRVPPGASKPLHSMTLVGDAENYFRISLEKHFATAPPSPARGGGGATERKEWSWSGRFRVSSANNTVVKLLNRLTGEVRVLRVAIELYRATAVVTIADEGSGNVLPLYKIRNKSNEAVHMFQNISSSLVSAPPASAAGLAQSDLPATQHPGRAAKVLPAEPVKRQQAMTCRLGSLKREAVVQRLLPGEEICFGWDEPEASSKLAVLGFHGDSVCVQCNLDELGQSRSVVLPGISPRGGRQLLLQSTVEGPTRLLEVCEAADLGGAKGAEESEEDPGLFVQVSMAGVGVSLVDSYPQELVYVSLDGLSVDFLRQPSGNMSLEVVLESLQVDNQLLNARLPVALSPTWKSTATSTVDRAGSRSRTFFHLSASEIPASHGCRFIEYFSVLVQEMDVVMEEALFLLLWRFVVECAQSQRRHQVLQEQLHLRHQQPFAEAKDNQEGETAPILIWLKSRWQTYVDVDAILNSWRTEVDGNENGYENQTGVEKWYFERIHLHPIKANVTFQRLVDNPIDLLSFPLWRGPGHTDGRQAPGHNYGTTQFEHLDDELLEPFDPRTILSVLPQAVPDVDGAQFKLNALIFENAFVTQPQLVKAISQSYLQQGLSQIYKIIGSAEILGNPIGLVTNLGSGVRDFFYEPAQGFVQSPQDFGEGIARGTRSLVHHTAFGTFDSVAKLSGAIGAGFASLSLDNEFVSERRSNLIDNVPKHVGDGVLLGAQSLGEGIFSGITGIVTQPIRGAEEGVNGFFKGVGKGLLGVAVRPAVGVFDMVARMFAGMRSTAALLDTNVGPARLRLPRMIFTANRCLKLYSAEMAFVQELLVRLWGFPRFKAAGSLIGALPLEENLLLVVTPNRISCLDYGLYRGESATQLQQRFPASAARPLLVWAFDTRTVLDLRGREGSGRLGVILSTGTDLEADLSRVEVMRSNRESDKCVLSIPARGEEARRLIVSCVRAASMGEIQRKEHYIWRRRILGLVIQPLRELSVPASGKAAAAMGAARAVAGSRLKAVLPDSGVGVVERVAPGSLSDAAGMKAGDLLVGYGGRTLESHDFGGSLFRVAELIPAGAVLEVMVWRQGKWLQFDLKFPEGSKGGEEETEGDEDA